MYAATQSEKSGAIAVTASHNPMEWNGLKFIGRGGATLGPTDIDALSRLAARTEHSYADWNRVGKHVSDVSWLRKHIDAALALPFVDLQAIRKRKFSVVLDCINASGGVILPKLLQELGCTVFPLNCDVSGVFSRPPEPVPENLADVSVEVLRQKADLGIVVDPDVDRLVLITEDGNPFGEEFTIAALVRFILEKEKAQGQTVVVNLSTTRAVDDIARKFGASVFRTPVGEAYVAAKMREVGAIIGGEGNGGVILPALHYGRDAIVAVVLMLQCLTEYGEKLSRFKGTLPAYSIVKDRISLEKIDGTKVFHALEDGRAADGRVNTDDGLRMDFPEYWIHLRKSNTEPILRIIGEARTLPEAEKVVEQLKKRILTFRSNRRGQR